MAKMANRREGRGRGRKTAGNIHKRRKGRNEVK
jgi:hypothetical protein